MAVEAWSVEDVTEYLSKLELDSLVPAFKENAVNGKDLLSLSDDDLKGELGCKPLQVRKIRNNLPSGAGAPPSATPAPSAPAAPAPAAAPAATREASAPPYGYPPPPAGYPAAAGYPPAGYPPAAEGPAPSYIPTALAAGMPAASTMAAAAAAPAPWASEDKSAKLRQDAAELERAAGELTRQAEEAKGQVGAYTQAGQLLRSAQAKLEGANKALKGVQVSGVVDMHRDRRTAILGASAGVGFAGRRMMMHNPGQTMLEMGLVQKANEACKSAAHDISQAKALAPEMPGVPEACVKSARTGVFVNALAPGIGGDIAQMAAVRSGMSEVEQMMRGVGQAMEWVGRSQAVLQGKAQELSAQAAAKQSEASAIKRMLD